ncbi:hypothetical protein [Nitrososphaera sp.]|uniref:hypothetical protein n=1 Tax=Nitrososphaera sp. TaxID=1971748 RepID=UPI00307D7C03
MTAPAKDDGEDKKKEKEKKKTAAGNGDDGGDDGGVGEEEGEGDPLPQEKWLVAYRSPSSGKGPGGASFVRQFFAPGYYEAYDIVLTHAEKMNLEVLWFREKRNCGPYMNRNYPELETLCTWCNRKFPGEPLPCGRDGCAGQFCSRDCMQEHAAAKKHHYYY